MLRTMYRVAVIGHTGRGNYGHGLDTVWGDLPNCELVAVADADPDGLQAAAKRLKVRAAFSDYRKMLDDVKPHIVSIAPRWLDQHHDMVLAAAERGIHIYMEKPMCRSVAEADAMVNVCVKNDVKLAIAFQTRYSPKLHVVREMLEDGKIGRLLELRARGKEDQRGGGEDLWVLGSHLMNLIHQFGGEPSWCFASVLENGSPVEPADFRAGNEGIGLLAGDTVHAMYGLDKGVTAHFDSVRNAGNGARFALTIFGSDGVIEMQTGYLPSVQYLADPNWSPGRSGKDWVSVSSAGIGKPEPLHDGGLHAGNVDACKDLIAAIEQDRQPEANVYEGRVTVEMIAAVFASQRAGGPVAIPLEERRG